MIRNRILCLRSVLPKPTVLFSTAVTPNENKKSTVIQKLLDEFTEAKPVILQLKKYDQMSISFNEWKNRISVMKNYGFNDLECFKMISEYPSLLEIPMSKFEGNIQQWRLTELGTDYFKSVLLNQPILLDIDEAVIRHRMPQLRVHFGSSSSVAQLLINSPNVMHDNWQGLLVKIDYLMKERLFKAGEISQSSALSCSLDFIKFRFDLLEKCGIYKQSRVPIHKENKYDKSGHINPPLKSILMENHKQFASIAKITVEEYEVYRDLFMLNENDSDSDTDD